MDSKDLKYTKEHEWIRIEGDRGTVGITSYAQEQLGDVVYVELPKVGTQLTRAQAFGVVESVKTASDLYSPVSGSVLAVNEQLTNSPELVNSDPYGEGWMIQVALSSPSEVDSLLSWDQYEATLPK